MATTKAAITKQVTILKRAFIKKASESYGVKQGDMVYIVKGDTGNVHVVTLRRNKKHTCTCPRNALGHKECYHLKHCVADANAQYAAKVTATEPVVAKPAVTQQQIVKSSTPVVVSPKVAEPQHYVMPEALYAKLASLSEEKPVKVEETEVVIEKTQSAPEAIVVSPVITEETSNLDVEQEVARQLSLLQSAKIDSLRWIARCRGVNIKSRTRQGLIDAIIASVRAKLEQKEAIAA